MPEYAIHTANSQFSYVFISQVKKKRKRPSGDARCMLDMHIPGLSGIPPPSTAPSLIQTDSYPPDDLFHMASLHPLSKSLKDKEELQNEMYLSDFFDFMR